MSKDYEVFAGIVGLVKKAAKKIVRALKECHSRAALLFPMLRYDRSLYHRATNRPRDTLKRSKGAVGEYLIYDKLRRVKGRWLFNVLLPKNGESTEIDLLLICRKGIFLFESKNFTGRIYGHADAKQWFQTVMTRRGVIRQRFFNPLMQNAAHKRALSALAGEDLPIYPAVIFGRNAEILVPREEYDENELMKIGSLRAFYRKKPSGTLDRRATEELGDMLERYAHPTYDERRKHLEYAMKKNR